MNGNGNGGNPGVAIYVMPTEEDQPPRAVLGVPIGPDVVMGAGTVAYVDGAWRDDEGNEIPEELAAAITEHAEELGVELEGGPVD